MRKYGIYLCSPSAVYSQPKPYSANFVRTCICATIANIIYATLATSSLTVATVRPLTSTKTTNIAVPTITAKNLTTVAKSTQYKNGNSTSTVDGHNTTKTKTVDATSEVVRSCTQWRELFADLNHYFRDEDILQGSDHSSVLVGYLIIVAYSLVIAFGAIGNLLTITAVCRNPQMRTIRNFFILNLALSDFFICTVTAPITLYTVLYMFWPFGTAFCKIVGSLQGFNIFLSTFSIAAIALDRYVLVIFPTQRDRQHNLALIFFLLIWLISILLALPLFTASDLDRVFQDKSCGILLTICHEQNQRWKQMALSKEMYTVGVLFIQYAFPLASIVFAYSRIARRMGNRFAPRNSTYQPSNVAIVASDAATVGSNGPPVTVIKGYNVGDGYSDSASLTQQKNVIHGSNSNYSIKTQQHYIVNNFNNASNNKTNSNNSAQFDRAKRCKSQADRYRRTNFLLISIVCVFAAAWLPLNIFHIFNTFHTSQRFSVPTFAICHCFAICSACLNPVSYAFFNHHFRAEFAAIFKQMRLIWLYRQFTNLSKTIRVHRSEKKLRIAKKRKNGGKCAAELMLKKSTTPNDDTAPPTVDSGGIGTSVSNSAGTVEPTVKPPTLIYVNDATQRSDHVNNVNSFVNDVNETNNNALVEYTFESESTEFL